jgi:hypothetical protein
MSRSSDEAIHCRQSLDALGGIGVGGLSKELTVAEMDARIAFLEKDNVTREEKLQRLQGTSQGLTQAQVTKLRKQYDMAKAEWRKRKRKVRCMAGGGQQQL